MLKPSNAARRRQRDKRAREEGPRRAWKMERTGTCGVCGRRGRVLRHHVVYEQHVRREGGDPWDLMNALDVGVRCNCHRLHHASGHARRPIPRAKLSAENVEFARRLMGEDRAEDYFRRHYGDGEGS